MIGDPEPARDRLEPEAAQIADGQTAAAVSQAISLKRIADALAGLASGDLGPLHAAMTHMAWEAGQSLGRGFEIGRQN